MAATTPSEKARYTAHFKQFLAAVKLPVGSADNTAKAAFARRDARAGASGPTPYAVASEFQYPEEKSYYCGPATAVSILGSEGYWYSAAYGIGLTQSVMANSALLQTDQNNGTNWSSSVMPGSLNWWIWGSTTGYYTQVSAPSVATTAADVVTDVDNGYLLGVAIHEQFNGFHLVGHPNRSIYHWFSTGNYAYGGYVMDAIDPAYNSPALPDYSGAQRLVWYYTQDIAGLWDGTYGLAW